MKIRSNEAGTETGPPGAAFDVKHYWSNRHSKLDGLRATGTLGAPLSWQQWLYKGKVRAYVRGLRSIGFGLQHRSALNFGCGVGYFEDVWESMGARHTAGIDIVEDVVEKLRVRYPQRSYRAGNLASNPALLTGMGQFDLVTALDVLYHVVDDDASSRIVTSLTEAMSQDGCFLFTDALIDSRPAPHVKFRSRAYWDRLLQERGLQIAHCEPVFILQNRPGRLTSLTRGWSGAVAYWADLPLSRLVPRLANNFAIFCTRKARPRSTGTSVDGGPAG